MPERRRRRRGARRRRRLLIAAGVGAFLLAVAFAWVAWTAQQVYDDLSQAEDDARAIREALAEGDAERAEHLMARIQERSESAADRTDSLAWGIAERLPFVGDDARALDTVSEVLSMLSRDGLEPLVESAAQLNARAFVPTQSQFPLENIAALEEPAARSHAAFVTADEELDAHDSTDLMGPLARAYDGLRTQVSSAVSVLDTAARAARVMPAFLGANGDRDYLFVFQNNAEIRSTGGLPGNLSLVHASDGRVEITRQAAAGPMGELPAPVLELAEDEASLYGPQLGTYFLDSNFTPDFPRASELWRARWQVEFGESIDGVFTLDPVTLSYLLQGTGPVQVGAAELTAENVVPVVENLVYLNIRSQAQQDVFLNAVAKRVFDTFASGRGDQVKVLQGLYRGVLEGRVRLHSFVPDEQEVLTDTLIAGELPVEVEDNAHVGVFLNDATGSKMSYYLQYDVGVTAVSCAKDESQSLLGRLEIMSQTPSSPEDLPETVAGFDIVRDPFIRRGQQLVVGDVFVPVGGSIDNIVVDGEPLDPPVLDELSGRQVVSIAFLFKPGEKHTVTWEMKTAPDQADDIAVDVTPGVAAESESFAAASAC